MAIGNNYPLSIMLTAVDRASATMNKVSRKMTAIGKSATKVGQSLTTSVTLPIVGIGVASTKMAVDFEKGMSNVGTLIDTNVESLDDMGKSVLEIARRTPVATDELTGALFDLRSAGVSAADQFQVLEGSAQLAVAGLGTTEEAAKLAAGAINAWGLEGEEADKVYDQIFKTTKNGITTISGLERGFGAVAATAAASGTPLDEYLASVSALTTTTLPAAQAHTQLKAVFAGLTRDTKQTRAVFGALGAKNFPDLIKRSGGFVNALRDVNDELGGDQAKMLKLVGSTEALNAILGLTGKQAEKFDDALADQRSGVNEMRKAFDKQNKTTAAGLQRTKNALQATAITIGKTLAPFVEKLADKVREAAAWFDGLDESTRNWIMRAAGIAAVLGPALIIFGKIATVVGLVLTPVGAVVALLVTAAAMIISEWEYFEQFFDLLWSGVVKAFEWAWSKIEPYIKRVQDGAAQIVKARDSVVDFFVPDDENAPLRPRRRVSPPAAAAVGSAGNANITVDFQNVPPGIRLDVESQDTNVDVSAGIPVTPLL